MKSAEPEIVAEPMPPGRWDHVGGFWGQEHCSCTRCKLTISIMRAGAYPFREVCPDKLTPSQLKLWDEYRMSAPVGPGETMRFRHDQFRYIVSLCDETIVNH